MQKYRYYNNVGYLFISYFLAWDKFITFQGYIYK